MRECVDLLWKVGSGTRDARCSQPNKFFVAQRRGCLPGLSKVVYNKVRGVGKFKEQSVWDDYFDSSDAGTDTQRRSCSSSCLLTSCLSCSLDLQTILAAAPVALEGSAYKVFPLEDELLHTCLCCRLLKSCVAGASLTINPSRHFMWPKPSKMGCCKGWAR